MYLHSSLEGSWYHRTLWKWHSIMTWVQPWCCGGFSQQEEDWRWSNRQSPSNRNKGTLSTSTSQRARGKHGDVVLFLTTMLFGCIVLMAQSSAWGEGSCKKWKLMWNCSVIPECYRPALINKTNWLSQCVKGDRNPTRSGAAGLSVCSDVLLERDRIFDWRLNNGQIPTSTYEDVIMHMFYYVPKNNPSTLLSVPQFLFWLTVHNVHPDTLRKWEEFSFSFCEIEFHESFSPVTMTVGGCCLLVLHDRTTLTRQPPPTHYPPLALSLVSTIPFPPSQRFAAFRMQIKPNWNKTVKMGHALFHHQTNVACRGKYKYCFFSRSNIYIFEGSKCSEPPHADTQTTAGWEDKRQETEMSLDFSAELWLVVLSTN